jgi:hypothetical protein
MATARTEGAGEGEGTSGRWAGGGTTGVDAEAEGAPLPPPPPILAEGGGTVNGRGWLSRATEGGWEGATTESSEEDGRGKALIEAEGEKQTRALALEEGRGGEKTVQSMAGGGPPSLLLEAAAQIAAIPLPPPWDAAGPVDGWPDSPGDSATATTTMTTETPGVSGNH